MKNKKIFSMILAFSMAFSLNVYGETAHESPEELIVFAAASMTELGDAYMGEHQNVTIVFNFDSSGTLKTQIEEGADADIFISAGQKQMEQLEDMSFGMFLLALLTFIFLTRK